MAKQARLFSLPMTWIIFTLIGTITATDCDDTWTAFEGSCYLFGTDSPLKFVEAEHFCRQHGGHLVHVNNAEENAFLKHYIHSFRPADYWMGLSDERVETVWSWYDTHTSVDFTDWIPGQPDNYGDKEDCAEFNQADKFLWNDIPCDLAREPICEINKQSSTEIIG